MDQNGVNRGEAASLTYHKHFGITKAINMHDTSPMPRFRAKILEIRGFDFGFYL